MLLLAGGLLVGCGGGDGGDGGNSSAGSASQASSSASPSSDGDGDGSGDGGNGDTGDEATPQPPFTANTEPDTQQASAGAFGNLTDIRVGRHDGFDRVVFEFGGPGAPGWDVRYVDQPAS